VPRDARNLSAAHLHHRVTTPTSTLWWINSTATSSPERSAPRPQHRPVPPVVSVNPEPRKILPHRRSPARFRASTAVNTDSRSSRVRERTLSTSGALAEGQGFTAFQGVRVSNGQGIWPVSPLQTLTVTLELRRRADPNQRDLLEGDLSEARKASWRIKATSRLSRKNPRRVDGSYMTARMFRRWCAAALGMTGPVPRRNLRAVWGCPMFSDFWRFS